MKCPFAFVLGTRSTMEMLGSLYVVVRSRIIIISQLPVATLECGGWMCCLSLFGPLLPFLGHNSNTMCREADITKKVM